MKRINQILLIFMVVPFVGYSQDHKVFPVTVSLYNEATAIPFTRLLTIPVHPGIQVGTEFNYTDSSCSRWFQTVNLGYFHHKHLNQGVGVSSEVGYEYKLRSGIAFTGLIGIGYMHTFATGAEYRFRNGQYEKVADAGNPRITPSFSVDAGYYFRKDAQSSKIFIRYQSWIEYPYSPGFIPLMAHINLHIGVKLSFTAKNNTK